MLRKAKQIFENNSFEHLEILKYKKEQDDILLCDMLKDLNLFESKGEAKRAIKAGSVKIDENKVVDEFYNLPLDLIDFKLSIGKKKYFRVIIEK